MNNVRQVVRSFPAMRLLLAGCRCKVGRRHGVASATITIRGMTVLEKREPKKSETIEIRLSHDTKSAFIRRCRDDEVSVSEAIRTMIDARIANPPAVRQNRRVTWRTIGAVAVGMALGAGAAAPALAHRSQISLSAFERLDRNHDGVLSYSEFRGR